MTIQMKPSAASALLIIFGYISLTSAESVVSAYEKDVLLTLGQAKTLNQVRNQLLN
jgi:hypothetical protein